MINAHIIIGLLVPFIGTTAGAACVFLMKRDFSRNVQRALTGFAAGVMVAASIWSLLIPAMSNGAHSHTGVVLFAVGFTLMMALDVALG